MHKSEMEKILEKLECGNLNARIANSLAIITLTAEILYTSGIRVDVKKIRDFLAESANKTLGTDSSIGERAFEKIKEEILRNQNNIEIRHRNGSPIKGVPVGQIWGIAVCDKDTGDSDSLKFEKVSIQTVTVEALLKANGFHNPEVIFREWKEKKHIATNQQGGIIFKVKIGKITNAKCLRFLL